MFTVCVERRLRSELAIPSSCLAALPILFSSVHGVFMYGVISFIESAERAHTADAFKNRASARRQQRGLRPTPAHLPPQYGL